MQEEGRAPSQVGPGVLLGQHTGPCLYDVASLPRAAGQEEPLGLWDRASLRLMAQACCFLAVQLGGYNSLKLRALNWEK